MIKVEWTLAVKEWAKATPQVSKVYFFGSRAKGTNSPESDLDIAITFLPAYDYGTWFHSSEEWKLQLSGALSDVEPHLCRGTANLGNPEVEQAIAEHGILVFDRITVE